jgi:hypothetical protein
MSGTTVQIPPPVADNGAPLPSNGDFGPNVLIFDPSIPSSQIQSQVDGIFNQQETAQFQPNRYAIFFKPGSYDANVQVGFYTTVHGLGSTPDAVTVTGGVYTTASWFQGNATQNFWRGIENLAIIPTVYGSDAMWATSQATWLRRLHVRGDLKLWDFTPGDGHWASGGFIADSVVDQFIDSGTQQQYLLRNSNPTSWQSTGGWNMVFVGDENAPSATWPSPAFTVVANTPVVREKPYLVVDNSNNYSVIVPTLKLNSNGTSWQPSWNNTGSDNSPSTTLPLSQFYVAQASQDDANSLNIALQRNLHLLLTPGVYNLTEPMVVRNPNTIVLGLGLATLSPTNGTPAMIVADVDGVTIAGILFDAGSTSSPNLLQFGDINPSTVDHSANPSVIFDSSFRVGGAAASAQATSCMVINSCNVILDNVWLWRADHGAPGIPTGWTINPCLNGLIVNSDNVTAYGLFCEHFQNIQTTWKGNGGTVYFYQSEEPYDVPSQDEWTQNGENGYPSYQITANVTSHTAMGLGIYCNFDNDVQLDNAIQSPPAPGISLHHFLTLWLSGNGGSSINHLVNGGGAAADQANRTSFSAA